MQYGDMHRHGHSHTHNHCHPAPSAQGSTVITVPIGAPAKSDCCDELRTEIKALKDELNRIKMKLAAFPDFASMPAGLLSSNGAKPATIAPQPLVDLAKSLTPLLDVERDVLLDAFGQRIPNRPA